MSRRLSLYDRRYALWFVFFLFVLPASAQDASTGAIRGTVIDSSGSRIANASIALVNATTGSRYAATSDSGGRFDFDLLPPGDYSGRAVAAGMFPQLTPALH